MTQIGMVTCGTCGEDKKIGGRCRCNPAGPSVIDLRGPKTETAAGENSGVLTRAMSAAREVGAMVRDAFAPTEEDKYKAPVEPQLLPLHELFRQVRAHNEHVLAILRQDRPDELLPPQVVTDIEVLREIGKWLEYSALPGLGHELTREEQADMEEHEESDNFAQMLLRYLAHATNDKRLLARVNRATAAEKWYQLRELKGAREALLKGRGNKGRADGMDSLIAALERELVPCTEPEKQETKKAKTKAKKHEPAG